MNEAATARANAMDMEVKKDGLAQQQSGAWVFKLKVHPEDMHTAIMQAPMGTRYKCVLVELNDDETPVVQPQEPKEQPKERRKFDELPLAQQAALLCKTIGFWRFLEFKCRSGRNTISESAAATYTRDYCNISSRSNLNSDPLAGAKFRQLKVNYQEWPGWKA